MLSVGVCTCKVDWLCRRLVCDCELELEDDCGVLGEFWCVEVPVLLFGVCCCHVIIQFAVW